MRTDITKAEPAFKPITVSITFENQKELDAMGLLFNTGIISTILRNHGLQHNLHDVFRDAGAKFLANESLYNDIVSHSKP